MVDDVAWGVGWGREGDGAGAGQIDDDIPTERAQINSSAYVHRDRHYQTGLQVEDKKKRRARSKSLPSRSLSPSSPSPSYRFPPSPSSSCSPPMSPVSPPLAGPIEIDVVSSPNIMASDFEQVERGRGRQMRKQEDESLSNSLSDLSFSSI